MRVRSGVDGFDGLVEGGLPEGSTVVLQGPPGAEKEAFALQFLAEGLRSGEAVVLLASSTRPEKLLESLTRFGVDVPTAIASNRLKIVDWYTCHAEAVSGVEERGPIFRASVDLVNVGIALTRALAGLDATVPRRATLEILSPALRVFGVDPVFAFAQASKAKLSRAKATSIFVVEKDMHDAETLTSLCQPFDGVVDIDRRREGDDLVRKIGVLSLKDTSPDSKFHLVDFSGETGLRVAAAVSGSRAASAEAAPAPPAQPPTARIDVILQIAEERVRVNPKDVDALFAKASALATLGEVPEAIRTLDSLIEVMDTYPGLWILRAKLLARVGDHEGVVQSHARREAIVRRERERLQAGEAIPCPNCDAQVPITSTRCERCGAALMEETGLAEELDRLGIVAIQHRVGTGLEVRPEPEPARDGPSPEKTRKRLVLRKSSVALRAPPTSSDRVAPTSPVGRTNGLQGRTNGLTAGSRGRTNGLRGRTNGLTAGSAGRTNGLTASSAGRTNGLTNGLTNGMNNGLVNGIATLRRGVTNGLTNGSGFTNGLSGAWIRRESRGGRWRLYLIPMVVALLLMAPLLASEDGPPGLPIVIDGQFGDWAAITLISVPPNAGTNPNVDLVRFGIADNVNSLAFYVEVAGAAVAGDGGTPGTMDVFWVFVDVDDTASSGYLIDGVGADRMVMLAGIAGTVRESYMWAFDAGRDPHDWNGWTSGLWIPAAAGGSRIEAAAAVPDLGAPIANVSVTVHAQSWDRRFDATELAAGINRYPLSLLQESLAPEVLTGTNIPLLGITATAGPRDVSFDSLVVRIVGRAAANAATTLRLVDGTGAEVSGRVPASRTVTFAFPAQRMPAGSTASYTILGDFSGGVGETYGVEIPSAAAVGTVDAVATVRTAPSLRSVGYVGIVPPAPMVDGGFAEWKNQTSPDPLADVVGGSIDVRNLGTQVNGSALHLYADVDGRILAGTPIPEAPRPVRTTVATTDADRDTVPDGVDPLPVDFDNDGTPDGAESGDVDSDGLQDSGVPGGPDVWLNTTIPASFPVPYANRPVSVYIGPTNRPVVLGDDVLRFFLDTDNSTLTGYAIAGIGANRLVEVRGKDGEATQSALLEFLGSFPGDWAWTPLSPLTVAAGYAAVELSVPFSASSVYLETGDFWGRVDMTAAVPSLSPSLAPARVAHSGSTSFAAAPAAKPLAVPWEQVGPEPTSVVDPSSNAITTLYNHQRKVVRAGDTPGTACDATNSDGCWYTVFQDQVRPPDSAFKDGATVAVPTTIGNLDSIATTLAAGDNVIVAATQLDNTAGGEPTIAAGNLELVRTGSPDVLLSENQNTIVIAADATENDGKFAILLGRDAGAPASPTYRVRAAVSAAGVNAEVKFIVISGSETSFLGDSANVGIGTAETTVLDVVATGFPAASTSLPNIIVAVTEHTSTVDDVNNLAGNVRLKRVSPAATLASNQFLIRNRVNTDALYGMHYVLVAIDSAAGADPTYRVSALSDATGASIEAKVLVFRGFAAVSLDTAAVAIGTSRTVIGTVATTFGAGDDVVIGAVSSLDFSTSFTTIAAGAVDTRLQGGASADSANQLPQTGRETSGRGVYFTLPFKKTTSAANPTYEGAAASPQAVDMELKLVAIHIRDATANGWDRVVLRRSADTGGSTWGAPITLASGNPGDSPLLYTFDSAEPSIAIDASGYLHVVWVSASAAGDRTTLDRIRYTKTTVAYPTQAELAAAVNWEAVTKVDDPYDAKVGAFSVGTGSPGTQVSVTVGFQPKAVIFWWSGRTESTDTAGTANHQRGFGAAISTTNRRAACSQSQDAATSAVSDSGQRPDAAICSITTAGGWDGLADLSSMDTNGFTIVIDDQFAANLRVHYLALGGPALTNVATGAFQEFGSTGDQDVTTVGFQPDAVIFFSGIVGPTDTAIITTQSNLMVGFAAGSGNPSDVVLTAGSEDAAATMDTGSYHRAGEAIARLDGFVDGVCFRGQVSAWLSNGFRMNYAESCAGTRWIHYLALKGGSYGVGDLLTSTTPGATITESGFGFAPTASLFLSHNKAQSTSDTVQDHDEISIGAFSSATDRGAQCIIDEHNAADADVGTAVEHDEVYCNLSTTTAIEGLMDVQSVDSNGFTLVMDDPDPIASFVSYMSFGPSAVYPGSMPTVSTDASNNPHVAWSGSKTSGIAYYRNKVGGTWRATVPWGNQYTGLSVDVAPADYVHLLRQFGTATTGGTQALIEYRSNTGSNTVNSPKTRTWDGSAWGSEAEEGTAGSPIRHIRLAVSPRSPDTRIFVTLSDDGWLDAYVCTPTCTATNNIGRVWTSAPVDDGKRFDIAYESGSGDALLVYSVESTDTTRDLAYRTYTGSWGAETYIDDAGHATDVQYGAAVLASGPTTDKIGLVAKDDTNDDVNAWIWDGGAWGNFVEIIGTGPTGNDLESIAIAWETNSGHLIAATRNTATDNVVSMEYTTAWSGPASIACGPLGGYFFALKPNPVGDDMIMVNVDPSGGDLGTCYWTGSAWAHGTSHDASTDGGFNRLADFAWESTGSKGLLVWGTQAGQITYSTFTAPNTWGAATNVAMGSNIHPWVRLRTNPTPGTSGPRVLGAVLEATANDLGAIRWDGSTLTVVGTSTFTADVGTSSWESFDFEVWGTTEVQYLVCKDLSTSNCDAASEFTKWDATAGHDVVATTVDSGSYPSLAATYGNVLTNTPAGDLWVAYAKDVDGTTRAIYVRSLDYPVAGWAAAEPVDSLAGTVFTRPSIGIDKDNSVHALYVATSGPQLYYKMRTGGAWGARTAIDTSSDNPTLMVRAPNNPTYGTEIGGLYWKTTTSETHFFSQVSIPEFELVAVPGVTIFLIVLLRRRPLRNRATNGTTIAHPHRVASAVTSVVPPTARSPNE